MNKMNQQQQQQQQNTLVRKRYQVDLKHLERLKVINHKGNRN